MAHVPTRYCDLVMKGGITSGIVYPNAVLALSRDFRFKNIGGTSAGAIAAAATAAAALGDRKKVALASGASAHSAQGFEGLSAIAKMLATEGFIYSLFQPARGARSAYRAVVILAGNAGFLRKLDTAVSAVVETAPAEFLAILALFVGFGFWAAGWSGMGAAVAPAMLCAYLGAAICAVLRVARVAQRNLLGLCSGLNSPSSRPRWQSLLPASFRNEKPALTDWMHWVLQSLSDKPMSDPLTFNDLWSAPSYVGEPQTKKAISLQMITTGVSHHEPRTLPFTDANFWFSREQFDLLFPKSVVSWMVAKAGSPVSIGDQNYYKLPTKGDMPVLVAMRMSLSFPLLISAVPLYEPAARDPRQKVLTEDVGDESAVETTLSQTMDSLATGGVSLPSKITAFRICWFSDGGISSNFPIHLFDAALPQWPTFAINLVYPKSDDSIQLVSAAEQQGSRDQADTAVHLPIRNNVGWQRTYQPIEKRFAIAELATFLFGIVGTMQNWRDLLQARAPGQRDRIVSISLDSAEGGMNLNMPQAVLDSIAAKGSVAGERLYEFSFANHYWIRWRTVASALQRYVIGMARNDQCEPKIPAYEDAFSTAQTGDPEPRSYKFRSEAEREASEALLRKLVTRGEEWDDLGPDFSKTAPRPLPQMQISPTY